MSLKNYYILLGISSTATATEIKTAYRELAKKYHPDKNQGNKNAEEFFKEIQQAYAVLSDPGQRKKYDLKFFFGTTYTRPKSGTPYTGNAYQYAQQQAREQAQQKYQFHNVKSQPKKTGKSESFQILISIGIALILLYFIISYSTRTKQVITLPPLPVPTVETPVAMENTSEINEFDSPYSYFFGEEVYITESKNSITIHNSNQSEAVVCLAENKQPPKTIRNQYISTGSTFKMNNIPDGEYFLKILYGNQWDTTKTYINNKIKGGFASGSTFVKLESVFKMKQEQAGTRISFSSYEITLDPYQQKDVKMLRPEEFFK